LTVLSSCLSGADLGGYADQVTAEDITAHHKALKKGGCSARTVHNRHVLVKAFLTYCGVSATVFGNGAPKFDKTLPEIYESGDLNPFLASLSEPYHRLIFNLLLQTGLREQEAMYLEWSDISFHAQTLTIRSKLHLGFRIKDKEERSVPVPSELLERLKEYHAAHPAKRFVIGTKTDRPNTKLLRLLKRSVHRAGLNCERCDGCKARNECENWFLHKFRATYCTQLLRSGLDLRTVQQMMGHSDIASTMRYLRPQEDAHTQSKINSIKWTL
jgi:integrase